MNDEYHKRESIYFREGEAIKRITSSSNSEGKTIFIRKFFCLM